MWGHDAMPNLFHQSTRLPLEPMMANISSVHSASTGACHKAKTCAIYIDWWCFLHISQWFPSTDLGLVVYLFANLHNFLLSIDILTYASSLIYLLLNFCLNRCSHDWSLVTFVNIIISFSLYCWFLQNSVYQYSGVHLVVDTVVQGMYL